MVSLVKREIMRFNERHRGEKERDDEKRDAG